MSINTSCDQKKKISDFIDTFALLGTEWNKKYVHDTSSRTPKSDIAFTAFYLNNQNATLQILLKNLITHPNWVFFEYLKRFSRLSRTHFDVQSWTEGRQKMKYHESSGEKWNGKQLSRANKRETRIVNFIKLSFRATEWSSTHNGWFCSDCNYSTHTQNPFAICLRVEQKFNFVVLLSFNRFPFVWQKWDFSFPFFTVGATPFGVFIFD